MRCAAGDVFGRRRRRRGWILTDFNYRCAEAKRIVILAIRDPDGSLTGVMPSNWLLSPIASMLCVVFLNCITPHRGFAY